MIRTNGAATNANAHGVGKYQLEIRAGITGSDRQKVRISRQYRGAGNKLMQNPLFHWVSIPKYKRHAKLTRRDTLSPQGMVVSSHFTGFSAPYGPLDSSIRSENSQ